MRRGDGGVGMIRGEGLESHSFSQCSISAVLRRCTARRPLLATSAAGAPSSMGTIPLRTITFSVAVPLVGTIAITVMILLPGPFALTIPLALMFLFSLLLPLVVAFALPITRTVARYAPAPVCALLVDIDIHSVLFDRRATRFATTMRRTFMPGCTIGVDGC